MADWLEILLRLGAAAALGGIIGLNRDLHHKPSGLRTLSLVAVGAALATLAVADAATRDPVSRIMQGLLTGVGFLGAGVIVRDTSTGKVHGLTTAAAIWVTTCLGALCGLGAWRLILPAAAIIAVILLLGKRVEKTTHKIFHGDDPAERPPEG